MRSAPQRRTRIKFCGMRREEDVRYAVQLGVDAVGFVFIPDSRRCIDLRSAQLLRRAVPAFVASVALLRNPHPAEVEAVVNAMGPDLLQFHGEEPAEFCGRFGRPYIKAIAMGGVPPEASLIKSYSEAAALLLDGHSPGQTGGQGKSFDWRLGAVEAAQPVIVAGGLVSGNVASLIHELRPYAVDVSSGIEHDPALAAGIKDCGKMEAFVDAVYRADTAAIANA